MGSRSSALNRLNIRQWFDIASLKDTSYRSDLQLEGLQQSAKHTRSIIRSEIETYGIPSGNICLGGLSQGYAMSVTVLLSLEYPLGGFVGMSGWLPFRKELDELMQEGNKRRSAGGVNASGVKKDSGGGDAVVFREPGETDDHNHNKDQNDPLLQSVSYMRNILSLDDVDPLTLSRDRTCLRTPVFLAHGVLDPKILLRVGNEAANTLKSIGLDVIWKSYPNLDHWYEIPEEIDDIVYFLRVNMG